MGEVNCPLTAHSKMTIKLKCFLMEIVHKFKNLRVNYFSTISLPENISQAVSFL